MQAEFTLCKKIFWAVMNSGVIIYVKKYFGKAIIWAKWLHIIFWGLKKSLAARIIP